MAANGAGDGGNGIAVAGGGRSGVGVLEARIPVGADVDESASATGNIPVVGEGVAAGADVDKSASATGSNPVVGEGVAAASSVSSMTTTKSKPPSLLSLSPQEPSV